MEVQFLVIQQTSFPAAAWFYSFQASKYFPLYRYTAQSQKIEEGISQGFCMYVYVYINY